MRNTIVPEISIITIGNSVAKTIAKCPSPKNFVAPDSVVQIDVDKDSLNEQQLVLKCDMGLKFWFDKGNQPKESLEKINYDYALAIDVKGDEISIELPEVENGIWQLYSQSKDANPSKLDIENGIYNGTIKTDTEFYAELYVNNKLVYVTPRSKVCVTEPSTNEKQDQKNDNDFPSLLDFWYWR